MQDRHTGHRIGDDFSLATPSKDSATEILTTLASKISKEARASGQIFALATI
jgi:hypothetical protein